MGEQYDNLGVGYGSPYIHGSATNGIIGCRLSPCEARGENPITSTRDTHTLLYFNRLGVFAPTNSLRVLKTRETAAAEAA